MLSRVIAHVDLDAFFAAVEQRDNPFLKGKPVVIGADPKEGKGRGVVSTCSYEARRYGIHSAMPISIAYRKCPHAHFLRGDMSKYKQASRKVFKIFSDFTPHVEPISIDEAFLDITGSYHLFGSAPSETGVQLRQKIREHVGLTASVGLAPVKMVAKIASDYCKPDGLLEIKEGGVLDFIHPLDVGKLWGVGPKTQQSLNQLGVVTVGDLAEISQQDLIRRFGEHGRHLYCLAHGIDSREVVEDEEIKSVSHEHTFEQDTRDQEEIEKVFLKLSEKVSRRLRRYELAGKTITVKIRTKGFHTSTRASTLSERTNYTDVIYRKARQIFRDFYQPGMWVRLIGVKVNNFEDPYVKDSLFVEAGQERLEKVHKAVDAIKDKFGESAIHRGR